MKLLMENWRSFLKEESLLTEISYEDVLKRFDSKKFLKAFDQRRDKMARAGLMSLVGMVYDIEPKEKAEALNWLISLAIKRRSFNFPLALPGALETFFHMRRQPGAARLLKGKQLSLFDHDSLIAMIRDVTPAYEEYESTHINPALAAKGINKIGETEDWIVYIPENKAASCKLGAATDWCTAKKGLSYYEQYHEEDHPLIIFHHKTKTFNVHGPQKKIVGKEPVKFQFHYGSEQYKDRWDDDLLGDEFQRGQWINYIQPILVNTYEYMDRRLNMTKGEIFSELNNIVISLKGKIAASTVFSAKQAHFKEERLPNGGFKRTGVYDVWRAPELSLSGDEAPWWSTFNKDGDLHSETGPAIKEYGGATRWYLSGHVQDNEEAWKRALRLGYHFPRGVSDHSRGDGDD